MVLNGDCRKFMFYYYEFNAHRISVLPSRALMDPSGKIVSLVSIKLSIENRMLEYLKSLEKYLESSFDV